MHSGQTRSRRAQATTVDLRSCERLFAGPGEWAMRIILITGQYITNTMALQLSRYSIKIVEKSQTWTNLITLACKFLLESLPTGIFQRLPFDSESNVKKLNQQKSGIDR